MVEYQFAVLVPSEVSLRWGDLRPLLAKAVAWNNGEMQVDDILQRVHDRKMFVMVMKEDRRYVLAMAGEIITYPRRKVLNIAFAGGKDLGIFIKKFASRVRDVAVMLQADEVQWHCRPAVHRFVQRFLPQSKREYLVVGVPVL